MANLVEYLRLPVRAWWRYALTALTLLIAGNLSNLRLAYIEAGWHDMWTSIANSLSSLSGNQLVDLVVLIAFWGAIGLGVYWLYLHLANWLIGRRNLATVELSYVNLGSAKQRRQYWLSRTSVMSGLVVLGLLTYYGLWPLWNNLFGQFISSLPNATGFVALLVSVVGAIINLHLLVVLTRLATAR